MDLRGVSGMGLFADWKLLTKSRAALEQGSTGIVAKMWTQRPLTGRFLLCQKLNERYPEKVLLGKTSGRGGGRHVVQGLWALWRRLCCRKGMPGL